MSNMVKLEVDPSIIEKNLDFRVNLSKDEADYDDPLMRLFPRTSPKSDEIPWKAVIPKPGFVVKTKTLEGDKIFTNICHCVDIPPPRDISEVELMKLLESEEPTTYTIPMSIGECHGECDKSGNLVSAYDIAVNTDFFNKIQENLLFKNFFLTVVLEGIEDKYKLELDRENVVILKHKKSFGTLQSHRIQQRPVRSAPKKLIEGFPDSPSITSNNASSDKPQKRPLIEELPDSSYSDIVNQNESCKNENNDSSVINNLQLPVNRKNNVRLIRTPKDGPVSKLVAFISISALSGMELELDVGEDRILVRSPRKKEMMDFFLPYNVDRDKVTAKYLVNTQTLRVDLPTKV